MQIISEKVNSYGLGIVKIVTTTKEGKDNFIVTMKKTYFLGVKVFESSTCRKRSMKDSILEAWGGEIL